MQSETLGEFIVPIDVYRSLLHDIARSSDEELNLPNPVPNLPALPTFISTPVVHVDNPSRFDR